MLSLALFLTAVVFGVIHGTYFGGWLQLKI